MVKLSDRQVAVRDHFRSVLLSMEEAVRATPGSTINGHPDCPVTHHFCNGIYMREAFVPRGMLLIGKIHRHDHPCFIKEGKILILAEDVGSQVMRGPMMFISKAGVKRVGIAMKDTIWITIHPNPNGHTKWTPEFEDEIIALTYLELEQGEASCQQ